MKGFENFNGITKTEIEENENSFRVIKGPAGRTII